MSHLQLLLLLLLLELLSAWAEESVPVGVAGCRIRSLSHRWCWFVLRTLRFGVLQQVVRSGPVSASALGSAEWTAVVESCHKASSVLFGVLT